MLIAVTGASGSIGKTAVPFLLNNKEHTCRLLLRDSKPNRKLVAKLKNRYSQNVEVIFGDVSDPVCCRKLVEDTDFVLHLAAVIPPKADHDEAVAWKTNLNGT